MSDTSSQSRGSAPRMLGRYAVRGELGRGGMGTVYRAHDDRLRRDVAIKVLPEDVRLAPARLARFEQEARTVAALSHPNIAAIYGIEEGPAGTPMLVLELIEGRTLALRIAQGPLPVDDALAIGRQIAQALDAAHEKGVVHRDLKPANIVITPSGLVKVLDFGVAKIVAPEELASNETATAGLTHEGMVVGTPAYMSPEQATGQSVDQRTDIWAFGCVLFEMLTGRRAFDGSTSSDTLAAVLAATPDWSLLPSKVPPTVVALLKRCLERDRFRRLGDVAALRFALEDLVNVHVADQPAPVPTNQRFPRSAAVPLAWMIGGALIAGTIGAALWPSRAIPTPIEQQRLTEFPGMEESPAISPDGKTVAFLRHINGRWQIWLRSRAGAAARSVTTDDADHLHPRWTPDSQFIVYFVPSPTPGQQGELRRIPALGGTGGRKLSDAIGGGGDISHDGQRIALYRLNNGHVELQVVALDNFRGLKAYAIPDGKSLGTIRWSPDDRWLAFQHSETVFNDRIYVVAVGDGKPTDLASAASIKGFAWLPDGSGLVYASSRGSTVLYPPVISLRIVSRDGKEDRALPLGGDSYTQPDVDPTSGDLVAARIHMQSDIFRIPLTGNPVSDTEKRFAVTRQTGLNQTPSLGPDNSEVAYLSDSGGHGNIWIAKTDSSDSPRQLTFEQDPDTSIGLPVWSPVTNLIAFIVSKNGTTGIDVVKSDGSERRTIVPEGIGPIWSADGRSLYYTRRSGTRCIEKIPTTQVGAPSPVRCDGSLAAAISRDNSTLYFFGYPKSTNGEIGTEIFKATPPDGKAEHLTSVPASRVSVSVAGMLNKDDSELAMPLIDGQTSNIWALSTAKGTMRKLTNFGDRSVLIARRVSWSLDNRIIYAAVAEVDANVVVIRGLWPAAETR